MGQLGFIYIQPPSVEANNTIRLRCESECRGTGGTITQNTVLTFNKPVIVVSSNFVITRDDGTGSFNTTGPLEVDITANSFGVYRGELELNIFIETPFTVTATVRYTGTIPADPDPPEDFPNAPASSGGAMFGSVNQASIFPADFDDGAPNATAGSFGNDPDTSAGQSIDFTIVDSFTVT